jgi:hypothetical protein
MHQCARYLVRTVNKMITETGKHYIIYICENCKKYYIKRGRGRIEVQLV